MEGLEGLTSAAAAVASTGAIGITPPSPPHDDNESDPVINTEAEVSEREILAPLTEEDHDQDHDPEHKHDHGHDEDGHEHAAETGVSLDDLKLRIIKQVEYYFSDENLPTDKFLLGFIRKNKEGFVPISVIASFRKMKKLTRDYSFIVAALRESALLVVSGDRKKVKRLNPFRLNEVRDSKLYTVLVENLPEDHSQESIRQIFGKAGNIKSISIHVPHANTKPTKHSKHEMLISTKLHAFVEYETVEAAEKAVATLNDEQDWRNGMRVKLLERTGKYGHRKQSWKGSDSENNSISHVPEQTGDEELHGSNEHHEDTHDEEGGEHLSKDKTGQEGRNRGWSRKHKYRGTNRMGHGSTSSTHHAVEPSKPPPGPKMPDGTRGFTMGRGRPPASAPN